MNTSSKSTAIAHANIALVKYWGKRDHNLNLPAVGSISVTLDGLHSKTTVEIAADATADQFILNAQPASAKQATRTSQFIDKIRRMSGSDERVRVISENNFPTGAGLASSASGFAALSLAATRAFDLHLAPDLLSGLAREGSGSAARSIFGGYVEMAIGSHSDGRDSVASPLFPAEHWPLRLLILITSEDEKKIGSTEGMNLTARTSPYYDTWIHSSLEDLQNMRDAIAEKDFQQMGEIAEFSCLKMHGLAMSANPGLIYWNEVTIKLIHAVRNLRSDGIPAYFTIDAGPQVKVICQPQDVDLIREKLSAIDGVLNVLESGLGPKAYLIGEND